MDCPATRPAWQEVAQPAVSRYIATLCQALNPGDPGARGWSRLSDRAFSPGLPFSSCSTATGSPGGGGSSTRLSSASTRPGRLGGQTPIWSPGWYWSPSWPPLSRRTRIVARLGVGTEQLHGAGGRTWEEEGRGQVGDVFLTWTCCFAGFPLRGLWLGTSSVCARGSGLGGRK